MLVKYLVFFAVQYFSWMSPNEQSLFKPPSLQRVTYIITVRFPLGY